MKGSGFQSVSLASILLTIKAFSVKIKLSQLNIATSLLLVFPLCQEEVDLPSNTISSKLGEGRELFAMLGT